MKGETDGYTIGDFYTLRSIMDGTSRQKINKERADLNNNLSLLMRALISFKRAAPS